MEDHPEPPNRGKRVGRGRPPEHSRFQKGVSGNPNGRPRKDRDLRKLVEAELDRTVSITENGRRVRMTKRQVVAKKLVNDAALGEARAQQALFRLLGASSEPDTPVVAVDSAELARFALRYLATQSGTDQKVAPGPNEAETGDGADDNPADDAP